MKVTDLTESYRTHFLQRNDPAAYEASRPEVFAHYHKHWGVADRPYVTLTESELAQLCRLITGALPGLESRFAAAGLDLSQLEMILLVGQGTSNGHGIITPNGAAAWLAVEAYTSPRLTDVFVAHEIAHALHYMQSPDFYFHDRSEQKAPLRQLITEGMATYVTSRVLDCDWGTALWADYLQPAVLETWMNQCRDRLPELATELLHVHRHHGQTEMFYANDPNDILKFRAGYYLGLAVIDAIASGTNTSPRSILRTTRADLEQHSLDLLTNPTHLTL